MTSSSRHLGTHIAARKEELARLIVGELWSRNPHYHQKFGEVGHLKCIDDVTHNLAYLSESISADSPRLFEAYVEWVKILFDGLGIPREDLAQSLEITLEVLCQRYPESAVTLAAHLRNALKQLTSGPANSQSYIDDSQPHGPLARQYLDLLRSGHRSDCSQLIMSAIQDGVGVKDIYLHVFQPCQREIGRLWQTNQMIVAEEHYCTAATQLIMSQLSSFIFGTKRNGKVLVATCVGGELHEIGLRMVADFFEIEGWDTYYLGSNTPNKSIIETLRTRNADLLLISATMTFNVHLVTELIDDVRSTSTRPDIPILVGGYPFNIEPELWKHSGASGYAPSALEAVDVAAGLMSSNE